MNAQKDAEGLLLPLERRRYLDAMTNALAGLDEARVVLAGVVKRMEKMQVATRPGAEPFSAYHR